MGRILPKGHMSISHIKHFCQKHSYATPSLVTRLQILYFYWFICKIPIPGGRTLDCNIFLNKLPDEKDEFDVFLERSQEWLTVKLEQVILGISKQELVQQPQSHDCFFTTFCREMSEVPSVPSYFSHWNLVWFCKTHSKESALLFNHKSRKWRRKRCI